MAVADAEAPPVAASALPKIWVMFRSGDGTFHEDWSPRRIADALNDSGGVLWVDIRGNQSHVGDVESLFRDVFRFHPLAIDDALRECHVPKVDDWEEYLYLVMHAVEFDAEAGEEGLHLHEIDMFLGANYLVTYHAEPISALENVRQAVTRDLGNRLKRGADHLLYLVMDQVVSEYMSAIDRLDDVIDEAQDEVFADPTKSTVRKIFRVKRAALRFHRVLGPQREVLNRLGRDEFGQIDQADRVYFRDVYDHLVRLHDITEGLRDLISGALDTYLSAVSNRTNEIMKTLTLVTVMFLPMTFLVGFFGMNFFGDTLNFHSPLPRTALFWGSCLLMMATPLVLWGWSRWRGWF